MPWAGNIAKTMTPNGKQFTVTRQMLTAVARDQKWPDVVARISARFFKFVGYEQAPNEVGKKFGEPSESE